MAMIDEPAAPAHEAQATHYDQLQKQIGEIRQQNGKSYHDGAQVEDWLDHTLGAANWSFRVIDHGRDEESDELWMSGELDATFWLPDDEGDLHPHRVVKQNFGSQQIKRFKTRSDGEGGMIAGKPISIGDDRKGAATDCLKRCARLLGVSRYLWRKPENLDLPYRRDEDEEEARNRPVGRPQGAPARSTSPKPAPAPIRPQAAPAASEPLDPSSRAAMEHHYEALREDALRRGFQASWSGKSASAWNDLQLPQYVGLLDRFLARKQGAA
jgi:hypothetical protein